MKDSYSSDLNPTDSACTCDRMHHYCNNHVNNEISEDEYEKIKWLGNQIDKKLKLRFNDKNKLNQHIPDIINDIQNDYNIFLEGHANHVKVLAMTNDNKYIISGSADNTIRI